MSNHVKDIEISQIRPWVRYWARSVDYALFSLLCGLALSILPVEIESDAFLNLIGVSILFFWIFFEALFLSTWGTTPGKWLLRITVRNWKGYKLNFAEALLRSFYVWLIGIGTGIIPIISLITQIVSYYKLTNHGITTWDEKGNFIVYHEKIGLFRTLVAAFFLIIFFIIVIIGAIFS
jgi:uncharacterized RDD family membrane protein YckC